MKYAIIAALLSTPAAAQDDGYNPCRAVSWSHYAHCLIITEDRHRYNEAADRLERQAERTDDGQTRYRLISRANVLRAQARQLEREYQDMRK